MNKNKRWLGTLSIALSIPSTIAGLALIINELVDEGIIGLSLGFLIFLLVISGMLWLMVSYAFNKKNKPD
tara:strand:- start:179 stop:388 length:210 start_codon:yes stop_codon:yes gene_type:complete